MYQEAELKLLELSQKANNAIFAAPDPSVPANVAWSMMAASGAAGPSSPGLLGTKPAKLTVYKGEPMTCSTCTAELAPAAHHQHLTAAAAPSWPSKYQNEKAQACDEHGRLYALLFY